MQRHAQQINGREGAGSDFHRTLSVVALLVRCPFCPASSQAFDVILTGNRADVQITKKSLFLIF